jgi:hypothetical protein
MDHAHSLQRDGDKIKIVTKEKHRSIRLGFSIYFPQRHKAHETEVLVAYTTNSLPFGLQKYNLIGFDKYFFNNPAPVVYGQLFELH